MITQALMMVNGTLLPTAEKLCDKCGRYAHRNFCYYCDITPCNVCGSETQLNSILCAKCRKDLETREETAKIVAAKVICRYRGPVYDGDEFYENLRELKEEYARQGKLFPEYVWPCHSIHHVFLDKNAIKLAAFDEGEAPCEFDTSDISLPDAADEFVQQFNDMNREHVAWRPDYERIVFLNKKGGKE